MKILFIHSLSDPSLGGGGEVIVWEQIRGLRDSGHDCVLLTTSNNKGLRKSIAEGVTLWTAGIRNLYWPYGKKRPPIYARWIWHLIDSYNFLMQSYIKDVLVEESPDIVLVHGWIGWSVACIDIIVANKVPAIQILHGHDYICAKTTMFKKGVPCSRQCLSCKALRIPHRRISRKLNAVVGVSDYILRRHLSMGYFNDVPIRAVIHNCRSLRQLPRGNASSGDGYLRFGYIGRLEESKGIGFLIKTFKAANLDGCELLVAGTGEKNFENRLRSIAHGSSISFLGYISPETFYSNIDVLVVPSLCNDNFPGAVFEALASGKPVIGSRRGGIPEMIDDGVNGLLFDPGSDGELANLLTKMVKDRSLLSSLAVKAGPSSDAFTDTGRWIKKYEDLCIKVLSSLTV